MNQHRYLSALLKYTAAVLLPAGLVVLTGCAVIPEPVREGPQQSPDPAQVRAAPEQYAGMTVRWGGVIVAVENGPEQSEVEVVSRPLSNDARPLDTDQTAGRFLVRTSDFLDPMDYVTGREITVVGVLDGVEPRNIGEHRYAYPVVKATGYYLWSLRQIPAYDPYFYAPFYDPWYPLGPYYYPYPFYYPYYYPQPHPVPQPRLRPSPQPRLRPLPQPQQQPQPQPQPRVRPGPFRE